MATWLTPIFYERHYIIFNFISNPLIDLGILFELVLCYFFFYTPLAEIYYFAPVPWHVYLFAFNGPLCCLFAFEETKKYYRRKGYHVGFARLARREDDRQRRAGIQTNSKLLPLIKKLLRYFRRKDVKKKNPAKTTRNSSGMGVKPKSQLNPV